MLPASGWLAEPAMNPVLTAPLPTPANFRYWKGGDGIITVFRNRPYVSLVAHEVGAAVTGSSGFDANNFRVFSLALRVVNVFNVLLLDSFTPPTYVNAVPREFNDELFDFAPSPNFACVTPHYTAEDVPVSGCLIGSDAAYEETTGADTEWQT